MKTILALAFLAFLQFVFASPEPRRRYSSSSYSSSQWSRNYFTTTAKEDYDINFVRQLFKEIFFSEKARKIIFQAVEQQMMMMAQMMGGGGGMPPMDPSMMGGMPPPGMGQPSGEFFSLPR